MSDFEVVWDGTRSKPWGRMLFAAEGVLQHPKVPEVRRFAFGGLTDRVRRCRSHFGEGWITADELSEMTGLTRTQVNAAVTNLIKQSQMEREFEHPGYGQQRYRFINREYES